MRKQAKHLTLNKETLRMMDGELSRVAGQSVANSCAACSATLACTVCTICPSACTNGACTTC